MRKQLFGACIFLINKQVMLVKNICKKGAMVFETVVHLQSDFKGSLGLQNDATVAQLARAADL